MPNEQTTRVAELFKSAVECSSDERSALLDEACANDRELREAVESLLAYYKESSPFLENSGLYLPAELLTPGDSLVTEETIDNYRIVSRIGSGGMGDVYLAEDIKLRRKVALKLVRRGMGTEGLLRRLRYEERILAGLNHPNIAQLYGGGVTSDGSPFFVMEYVDGVRIDHYSSAHGLSIAARLNLFRKVCSPVQFAHQHLIVHRDIKPSNILITKDGEPKLLDFGIAKLLDCGQRIEGDPTITIAGAMTPEYASPEHVRGEAITTTSDVYSLGVLLYELLTGTRPYRVTSNRPEEIVRVITTQEPERPSAAVSKDQTVEIKQHKLLHGDLDTIVLMALRKEPERRYVSVAQFSDDIRRHLDGRPLVAHRDSVGYRASRFIARNRLAVTGATVALVALLCGLIAFALEARVASKQRDAALEARDKAQLLSGFLDSVFLSSDPGSVSASKQGRKVTLEQAVDEAGRRAEVELAKQPDTLAKLESTIGYSYLNRGEYELAERYLRGSIASYRKVYGSADRAEIVDVQQRLGGVLLRTGRYAEGEALYRNALAFYRKVGVAQHPEIQDSFAGALSTLGYALRLEGRPAEAEALHREELQYVDHWSGEKRHHVAILFGQLAFDRSDQGDLIEAEKFARMSVDEFQKLPGAVHLDLANAFGTLCVVLKIKGAYAEAEASMNRGMEILNRFVADSHPAVAAARNELAELLYSKGENAKAQLLAEDALALSRRTLPANHVTIATPLTTLGLVLIRSGHPDLAEPHLREALKLRQSAFVPNYWRVAASQSALGECLAAQGKLTEAEPLLLNGYRGLKASLGETDPRTVEGLQRIVKLYELWQRPADAANYRALLPR